jgi:hypothetical protein
MRCGTGLAGAWGVWPALATLGSAAAVGALHLGWIRGPLGGAAVALATRSKILASWVSACSWASPKCAKGAAEFGCWSACVKAAAAAAARAAAAEDVFGIWQLWGGDSTVSAMRSAAVLLHRLDITGSVQVLPQCTILQCRVSPR